MDLIKKLARRKLGVAVGGGAALAVASPEAIWPTAFVAAIYSRASDRGHLGQLRRSMGVNGIIYKQGVIVQARLA